METAVDRYFLTAGSACLQWSAGGIEPEVTAGDEVTCNIDIVILKEDDFSVKGVRAGDFYNSMKVFLSVIVMRMGFPGEDDLNRSLRIIKEFHCTGKV